MKNFFKLDSNLRKKRLIRSAIIFPIAAVILVICNDKGISFSLDYFLALFIVSTMVSGFPYGWNICRNIIRGSYIYDDVTGNYYPDNRLMTIVMLYPLAFTVGLFVGGISLVIDFLMFLLPTIYEKFTNK